MRKSFKYFLIIGLLILLCPYLYLWGKPVHVSIDDVSALSHFSVDSHYESIFDEPLLGWLQRVHKMTGAKITLYVYEQSVGEIPEKYWGEFRDNASWLRLGFHATSPQEPITQSDASFIASYLRLDSVLSEKCPENKASTLRLHYWKASPTEIAFLREKGIQCLLSADRDTKSYSLTDSDNQYLQTQEFLVRDGMAYEKTDFRVENSHLLSALWNNVKDEKNNSFYP